MRNGSVDSLKVCAKCNLDAEEGEPALHRALGKALGLPQRARAPVRGGVGFLLQCAVDHAGHLVVVVGPGPSGPHFVVQPLDAGLAEASPPLADGVRYDADTLGDGRVGQAFGTGEDDAGAHDQGVERRELAVLSTAAAAPAWRPGRARGGGAG